MRFLAVLLLANLAVCSAQVSSSVSLGNGLRVSVRATFLQAPGVQSLTADLAAASGNSFYRIFRDENGLAVFAYELAIERTRDGKQVRVTAKPATARFAEAFPNADGGKPTPTLSSPLDLPPLSSGKPVAIDLFDMPPNGQVTDTVEFSFVRPGAPEEGSPVPGQLRLAALSVKVNGKTFSAAEAAAAVSGRYVMFYLPGWGGYFFTAGAPERPGFVKAGWIAGRRMQFTLDNVTVECTTSGPILTNSTGGEVWVYRDPLYKPAGNWTETNPAQTPPTQGEFFAAASDSLNWFAAPKPPAPAR
jgi:hypothetical protein